jgi:hypothetical protein
MSGAHEPRWFPTHSEEETKWMGHGGLERRRECFQSLWESENVCVYKAKFFLLFSILQTGDFAYPRGLTTSPVNCISNSNGSHIYNLK